ncbi:MAG TPA: hypothetical protein VJT73_02320 [Polyangiaceae bacterium]|nr:hypothetical protein [Polyangiaceae bacterium]
MSEPPASAFGVAIVPEEPRPDRWRSHAPSAQQWKVASACIFSAALVGFFVGRSSARSMAQGAASSSTSAPEFKEAPARPQPPTTPAQPPDATVSSNAEGVPALGLTLEGGPTFEGAPSPTAEKDISAAIQRATTRALARCRGESGLVGTARVAVTFRGSSGNATTSAVQGVPGAHEIECINARFRQLHVPPFAGGDVTVRTDIVFE